jgi:hypothetical protein
MRCLANLPTLHYLVLDGTAVTDRGLEVLRGRNGKLPGMSVSVRGTSVSAKAVEALENAMHETVTYGPIPPDATAEALDGHPEKSEP